MAEVRTIIPEKLFVGLGRSSRSSHPHASVTAWGTDSASKGRMQTVQSNSTSTWCVDNMPQWGVRIGGRAWRDELYIQDPRGFSVSVGTHYVLELMRSCTVVDGVIQAPCVWARSAGHNVLLNVGSEAHELATIQTRVANSKVSLKQVKLGDWITLTNGTQGVYLGKLHSILFDTNTWVRSNILKENRLSVDDGAKVVIWQPHVKRGWKPHHAQTLLFLGNPVVAEHVAHDHVYTECEAELKVNELLNDASCYVVRNTRSYGSDRVMMATRKLADLGQLTIKPEPIICASEEEVNALPHKVHYSEQGTHFWVWAGQQRNSGVSLMEWDLSALNQNQLKFVTSTVLGSHTARNQHLPVNQVLSNLYVMRATYVSSLGNKLEALI